MGAMLVKNDSSDILEILSAYISSRGLSAAFMRAIQRSFDDRWQSAPNSQKIPHLFERAAELLRDDSFGLQLAIFESVEIKRAPIAKLTANAPTLHVAFHTQIRFFPANAAHFKIELKSVRKRVDCKFIFVEDVDPQSQFIDFSVTRLIEWVRALLRDDDWSPVRIDFAHARPKQLATFKATLGTRLHFGTKLTRIVFDEATLKRAIPDADNELLRVLLSKAEAALQSNHTAQRIVRTVEAKIREQLPEAGVSGAKLAASLRISQRTLQRALNNQGTTFRELLDRVRKQLCADLLLHSDLSMTEIAFELGYGELSAFSRAARVWFGQTPHSLRRQGRLKEKTQN